MRWVQVWFTCSAKDCEAKAEILVKAYTSSHAETFRLGHSTLQVATTLPEGWGTHGEPADEYGDQEGTFCPAHCWR